MMLAIAISIIFGLTAALSVVSCAASLLRASRAFRSLRAELTALDRPVKAVRVRRPQEAIDRAVLAQPASA